MAKGTCTVEVCDRPVNTRGFCTAHYARWRKGQPVDTPVRPFRALSDTCAIDGCVAAHYAHGWCKRHYDRWRNHGDPTKNRSRSELHFRWTTGVNVTYTAVHLRLRKIRGSATHHPCVDCGRRAQGWSYNGKSAEELRSDDGLPYTADLSCYEPRCVACHWYLDRGRKRLEQIRAEAMVRTDRCDIHEGTTA